MTQSRISLTYDYLCALDGFGMAHFSKWSAKEHMMWAVYCEKYYKDPW